MLWTPIVTSIAIARVFPRGFRPPSSPGPSRGVRDEQHEETDVKLSPPQQEWPRDVALDHPPVPPGPVVRGIHNVQDFLMGERGEQTPHTVTKGREGTDRRGG